MPVITAIDVLGVQRYIFATNRLRDIVSASYLVHWATSRTGALESIAQRPKTILLAGGGNATVVFDDLAEARSFAAQYTRLLYEKTPDLETVIVHYEYTPGSLAQALLNLQREVMHAKMSRKPDLPLLGISVTANCSQTGMPAVCLNKEEGKPISRRVAVLNKSTEDAAKRWKHYLPGNDYSFPLELDSLGRTHGDTSFIAVVHIDGNGIGKKMQTWLKQCVDNMIDDEALKEQYADITSSLDTLGNHVFRGVIERTCSAISTGDNGFPTIKDSRSSLRFELKQTKDKNTFLPVRPILLGGDDMTFVCDARIAHDLMSTALKEFTQEQVPKLGTIHACAGASLVHSHAPFIRAYEAAAQLCARAKQFVRENNEEGCALDWHIGLPRPGETLEKIWARQYQSSAFTLSCRPYRISQYNDVRSWNWFETTLMSDSNTGLRSPLWTQSRNKIKALTALTREGPDAIKEALAAWRVVNKQLNFPAPISDNGFSGDRSPLLDAVELIDIYMNLERNERTHGQEGE